LERIFAVKMAAVFSNPTTLFPSLNDVFPSSAPTFAAGMILGEMDAALAEKLASKKEDEALVARAQAGDSVAFDSLVVKHSPKLYSQMYHMTSNHEDANDMLQDVWMKVYRNISGFRGKSAFSSWLHSIASNTAINFINKRVAGR
jgi:hypothetical protein